MTHLYTLLVGGRIARGGELRDATALVVAADTVLFVGTDEEAAAVSRGESMTVDLSGAEIVGTGELEVGSPADFEVWSRPETSGTRPVLVARVRGGRLVEGALPGWHDHAAEAHEHS